MLSNSKVVILNLTANDKTQIVTASGEKVPIIGKAYIDIDINDSVYSILFYIVSKLNPQIILGLDFLHKNNVLLDFEIEILLAKNL